MYLYWEKVLIKTENYLKQSKIEDLLVLGNKDI